MTMENRASPPGWTGETPVPPPNPAWATLFLHRFLLRCSEAGFDSRADARQHVFGWLRELALGLKLKIFLEGLGRACGGDHLIALERGFADQINALPVVRFSFGRIGGNDFVECHNRIIHLARIGENSAFVEQVRAGMGWI